MQNISKKKQRISTLEKPCKIWSRDINYDANDVSKGKKGKRRIPNILYILRK